MNDTIRCISDFRELNKTIKIVPFQICHIVRSNYAYFHISSCPAFQKLCTAVLPLNEYEYQTLPMVLGNSPDIFEQKMNESLN